MPALVGIPKFPLFVPCSPNVQKFMDFGGFEGIGFA